MSGKIWFSQNMESRNFSNNFETIALELDLKNVGSRNSQTKVLRTTVKIFTL